MAWHRNDLQRRSLAAISTGKQRKSSEPTCKERLRIS
nr:MAG TPA: hypothetical protein [Caudoviricetes sp.]